jgi:hypothetical protein
MQIPRYLCQDLFPRILIAATMNYKDKPWCSRAPCGCFTPIPESPCISHHHQGRYIGSCERLLFKMSWCIYTLFIINVHVLKNKRSQCQLVIEAPPLRWPWWFLVLSSAQALEVWLLFTFPTPYGSFRHSVPSAWFSLPSHSPGI